MVFAEQRLLPMAAQSLKEKIGVYGKLSDTFHLETNSYISHIWNSKGVYKEHTEARAPFCKWIKNWLLKNHPEATAILDKLIPEPAQHAVGSYSTNAKFTIVGAVKPGTLIRDANVTAFRPAKAGDTLYFGEKLVAP